VHWKFSGKAILLGLGIAALCMGENFKLYLKDGDYHSVREYQVQGHRIRYFSTERGEWEEIPKELVDLNKTESERKSKNEELVREARAEDEEEKAERAHQKEIASIPMEAGAYYKVGDEVKTVKASDYEVITNKKRRILQTVSPVPLIPGKAIVTIKGEHAPISFTEERPSFFLRLAKEERFGIIRLTPRKGQRVVENISIVPVSKQAMEERKQVDTFQQQLMWNLYRVWPEKALEPGEYALMEYTSGDDTSDIQLLIWDFAIQTH
jgi:hypothetical protein